MGIFGGTFTGMGKFIVAPLAGAVMAALVYKLLSYENLWLQYQKQNLKNGGQSVSDSVETEE